ncbi:MAG: NAD(P)-dependent oxidoreductase [Thermoplasmatales archaeon]|nr:NAD(P)-dependent oxidoreductase [Thermoplasmatales archaeon]
MNRMRVLVTGATGFIGSKLVEHISKDNVVYCIARSESKIFQSDNVNWIIQDLSKELNNSILPKKLDAIIHLAQSKHYRNFPEKALDIFLVNDYSTVQLLDYGRRIGIKSFVFASSGSVYARKGGSFLEDDPLNPTTFYPNSKLISEYLVSSYSNFFSTTILRYFSVYGEGQKNMLIPNLINSVKEGRPIIIYNEEGIKLTPTYIDDAVRATASAISIQENETINVAGGEVISILKLSEIIGEVLGKKPVYEYKTDPNAMDFVANIDKMKSVLGVVPEVSIKEGIKRTITGGLHQ